MTAEDRERVHGELDALLDSAPQYGSIALTVHVHAGRVVRLESARSQSVKAAATLMVET